MDWLGNHHFSSLSLFATLDNQEEEIEDGRGALRASVARSGPFITVQGCHLESKSWPHCWCRSGQDNLLTGRKMKRRRWLSGGRSTTRPNPLSSVSRLQVVWPAAPSSELRSHRPWLRRRSLDSHSSSFSFSLSSWSPVIKGKWSKKGKFCQTPKESESSFQKNDINCRISNNERWTAFVSA